MPLFQPFEARSFFFGNGRVFVLPSFRHNTSTPQTPHRKDVCLTVSHFPVLGGGVGYEIIHCNDNQRVSNHIKADIGSLWLGFGYAFNCSLPFASSSDEE